MGTNAKTISKHYQFNLWDILKDRGKRLTGDKAYDEWRKTNGLYMTLTDIDKAIEKELGGVTRRKKITYDKVTDGIVWLKDVFPDEKIEEHGVELDYLQIGQMAFLAAHGCEK